MTSFKESAATKSRGLLKLPHHFTLIIDGRVFKIHEYGNCEYTARIRASEKGYKILMLVGEKSFIDGMSFYEQLQLLHSYGFVRTPRFHYELYPAFSGNSTDVWRCFGNLSDPDTEFESEAATQFDSREQVSYAILCNVLGIEPVEFPVEERTDDAACQTAAHPVGIITPASAGTDNIIVFHTSETCVHGQGLLKYIISRYEATA